MRQWRRDRSSCGRVFASLLALRSLLVCLVCRLSSTPPRIRARPLAMQCEEPSQGVRARTFASASASTSTPPTTNGYHKESNGINGVKHGKFPSLDWSYYDTSKESFEQCSFITTFLTRLGIYVLIYLALINRLLFKPRVHTEFDRKGYIRLFNQFDELYSYYVYRRVRDCWNRPICSSPGAEITLKDRVTDDHGWTFRYTGSETKCINLGSYNYLGFAEATGVCADDAEESIKKYGLTLASPRAELGTCPLHEQLEKLTAQFLGTEAAMVVGMGFATNSLGLPALLGPGCLAISDEFNHASLILGLRISQATVAIFKHNDMRDLEKVVRQHISQGQDRPGKPWKPWRKILIVVEGVYSMEGSIVRLPELIAIKKRYNCYVYLDEAHSIGATGPRGRGITDYYGIDPKDIDILMGTFTKSFGSAGGYIAGSKKLINHVNKFGHASTYAYSMSPPVIQQIISSMELIMGVRGGDDGKQRIDALARNTRYFRRRLHQMGVIIYGHEDSPVVPMLVYLYSKIGCVVRELTASGVAVVGVGFPATPLLSCRIRFCMSAAHSKEQLDWCLDAISKVSNRVGLIHSRRPRNMAPIPY
ncbi:serine palmitoyltransferase long chain base subunit [Arctopsyche grandis]|uniref:serine palmitoyltransferase long chain base subunit n=1 Tax=Arctopsyche grandis TaxID=121162 RepID=UPI00406D6BD8